MFRFRQVSGCVRVQRLYKRKFEYFYQCKRLININKWLYMYLFFIYKNDKIYSWVMIVYHFYIRVWVFRLRVQVCRLPVSRTFLQGVRVDKIPFLELVLTLSRNFGFYLIPRRFFYYFRLFFFCEDIIYYYMCIFL